MDRNVFLRYIAVAFVFVVLLGGLVLVTHAQENESGPAIDGSYDYGNGEVDYEIDGNPFIDHYNFSALQANTTYSGDTTLDRLSVESFVMNETGDTYWYTSNAPVQMHEVNLNEPFDISTQSNTQTYSISTAGSIEGLEWSDDGSRLFNLISTSGASSIGEYSMSSDFSFDSPPGFSDSISANHELDGLKWINDGEQLLSYNVTDGNLVVIDCNVDAAGEPYSLGTLSGNSCDFNTKNTPGTTDVSDIDTNDDESKIYLTDESGEVIEYDFSNDYELSNPRTHTIPGTDNPPEEIEWIKGGEGLMAMDVLGSEIYGYSNRAPIDVWLEDSDGEEIPDTRTQTTSGESGSISYSSELYQQVTVNYESERYPSLSNESDPISIYGDGVIEIRSERDNSLIDEPMNVTAYGEESGIYSLDTSDGTIDITDLPDQQYTFSVSGDGYLLRNRQVAELGGVSTLYTLSNDTDTITSQFTLQDTTNTYDSDSRLVIQRAIMNNWETVYADSFGTEGVTVQLEEDTRYRIALETEEGERQVLGPYRSDISQTVSISPSSGVIPIESEGSWSAGASYSNDRVYVRFDAEGSDVSEVSIDIHERGNESNTLASDDTYTDVDDLQVNYPVPPQYNETNWRVSIEVSSDGSTETVGYLVGPSPDIVPAQLDPMWQQIIATIVLVSFGMAFSVLNRAVGGIAVGIVGGILFWIGWLNGVTVGAAVSLYLFLAVVYAIFDKSIR